MKALGVGEHLHVRSAAPLDDCERSRLVFQQRNPATDVGFVRRLRHAEIRAIQHGLLAGKNLRQPGSRPCIQSQGFAKTAGKLHGTAFDCIARGVILGASMEQVDVLVKLHEPRRRRLRFARKEHVDAASIEPEFCATRLQTSAETAR
ncbi:MULTISPECIES: hypothetical protein [Variovorax]|uniref:hypothetical protein n=1 Tax=Variovorax TaxID=34072 RepID=UPI0021AD1A38|nr:hypothetical protein [Variovorax paradoxus]UVH56362.1 hypothetical protein NWF24_26480 [Variovorax paradoxus]